jgi:hypothetical protein
MRRRKPIHENYERDVMLIFHIDGGMYQGIDPRRYPPNEYFSVEDWSAQQRGLITDQEYQARYRLRRRLGLKGSDPLPSAELIDFPRGRVLRSVSMRSVSSATVSPPGGDHFDKG